MYKILKTKPFQFQIDPYHPKSRRVIDLDPQCKYNFTGGDWTPHKIELAVWTHYVMNEYKAETLLDMPSRKTAVSQAAATDTAVTTSVTASNGTDKVTYFKIKSCN